MPQSIILIGMNVRPVASSAAHAGNDVASIGVLKLTDMPAGVRQISLMDDLGGIFPPDPDAFHARICQAALTQPVTAVAYSGGFENFPELLGALAEKFELLGNPPDTLAQVRDPRQLQDAVAAVGMKTPLILAPGSTPDPGKDWLRKPVKSGAGGGIEPWEGVVPDDPDHIVQQRIEGIPQSVSFIANGREARIFAFSEQLIGNADFGADGYQYVGNLLLPEPDRELIENLEALANHLTRSFGLVGLNGIDFIQQDSQIYILEVNGRYSASMELYEDALGQSIFGWHAAGCRGEPLPELPNLPEKKVYGKAAVISRRHGILKDTAGWAEMGRRDVQRPGMLMFPKFPICFVTASADNRDACYAILKEKADDVAAIAPGPHGFATLRFFASQLFGKNKGLLKLLINRSFSAGGPGAR